MKQKIYQAPVLITMSMALAFFAVGCEANPLDEGHMQHVEFTYTPDPALSGTEISMLFIVEMDGMHMSVTDPACELHTLGAVALSEGEAGHYSGVHTFATAGTYDVHFSFTHDGAPVEEQFTIIVQ